MKDKNMLALGISAVIIGVFLYQLNGISLKSVFGSSTWQLQDSYNHNIPFEKSFIITRECDTFKNKVGLQWSSWTTMECNDLKSRVVTVFIDNQAINPDITCDGDNALLVWQYMPSGCYINKMNICSGNIRTINGICYGYDGSAYVTMSGKIRAYDLYG